MGARLAIAHMSTEEWAEDTWGSDRPQALFAPSVVRAIHARRPKGAVHFAVPFRALRFLFPALWPEAEAGS